MVDRRFHLDDDRHANTLNANKVLYGIEPGTVLYCRRCGRHLPCPHINCDTLSDPDHAARIRARYALGKRFHPEGHDTADYFTDPPAPTNN